MCSLSRPQVRSNSASRLLLAVRRVPQFDRTDAATGIPSAASVRGVCEVFDGDDRSAEEADGFCGRQAFRLGVFGPRSRGRVFVGGSGSDGETADGRLHVAGRHERRESHDDLALASDARSRSQEAGSGVATLDGIRGVAVRSIRGEGGRRGSEIGHSCPTVRRKPRQRFRERRYGQEWPSSTQSARDRHRVRAAAKIAGRGRDAVRRTPQKDRREVARGTQTATGRDFAVRPTRRRNPPRAVRPGCSARRAAGDGLGILVAVPRSADARRISEAHQGTRTVEHDDRRRTGSRDGLGR